MTQKGKEFAQYLSENPELTEKLNARVQGSENIKEVILRFAKEQGYDVTAKDFVEPEKELLPEELAAVAGGSECYCALGGGGTQTENEHGTSPACGCVLAGIGMNSRDGNRCACEFAGYGKAFDEIF